MCSGTGFTSENKGALRVLRAVHPLRRRRRGHHRPLPDLSGLRHRPPHPLHHRPHPGRGHRRAKVRLAGQGEAGPNGKPAGDLFVTVHVRPDKVFTRSGDDLEITIPVSLRGARPRRHRHGPDSRRPGEGQGARRHANGRTLRVRGRGVPKRGDAAGDLLVTVEATVPKNLDAAATSALRAYAQAERVRFQPPRGLGRQRLRHQMEEVNGHGGPG
ncbi:DnaJ C-terminal domain-containing protein [Corynebacterium suedekumii]|nr:DnaJ C-terminal domain-containing protein [Corynebacterium suedekumii]